MKKFLGFDGKATFKPVKAHKNKKRQDLSTMKKTTLGTGSMLATVVLPPGEDLNEWLAVHVVDFYNDVSLMYGLVADDAGKMFTGQGEGFPQGFEYRWADGVSVKKPIRCSSPEYVDYVMTWVDGQIANEEIFPTLADQSFPKHFQTAVADIFKRLFRVYAIIYSQPAIFSIYEGVCAAPHLNTSFKHFMFFALEFNLLKAAEFRAIPKETDAMAAQFAGAKEEMGGGGVLGAAGAAGGGAAGGAAKA